MQLINKMDGKEFLKIQLKSFSFSRIMLMLYELEVLQSDCERIGDPVALPLTDIINGNTNTNRLGKNFLRACSECRTTLARKASR